MEPINPYQSPLSDAPHNDKHLPTSHKREALTLRAAASGLLAVASLFFILLLNGQSFTNGMVVLLLCIGSASLWLPLVVKQGEHRRLAMIVALGHVVLVVAICAQLPAQYEAQQRFNETMQQLRDPHSFKRKL